MKSPQQIRIVFGLALIAALTLEFASVANAVPVLREYNISVEVTSIEGTGFGLSVGDILLNVGMISVEQSLIDASSDGNRFYSTPS